MIAMMILTTFFKLEETPSLLSVTTTLSRRHISSSTYPTFFKMFESETIFIHIPFIRPFINLQDLLCFTHKYVYHLSRISVFFYQFRLHIPVVVRHVDEVSTSSKHRVQIKDPFCQTQEEKLKIKEQIITRQALILFENTTASYL